MATRPVFIPKFEGRSLVQEREFDFLWAPGFSKVQKRKNINALHEVARKHDIPRILEISSKSAENIGKYLSAFSLKFTFESQKYPLESVYQGSKVFENGGPFTEIFNFAPRDAKRFIREHDYGRIIRFELEGKSYPLSPKNAFYDWLYIRSLADKADSIIEHLIKYDGFTDIEFNPAKQFNCQARALAEYLSLHKRNKLQEAAANFDVFAEMLEAVDCPPLLRSET